MNIISGGISGAITDPYSDRALKHAEMFYEEMRHTNSDVEKIAKNTNYKVDVILMVKNYLFTNEHILEDGIRRFDADFAIAQSWQRLAYDKENIKPHDLTLLEHELMEMELIAQGLSQAEAHNKTSQMFNYGAESEVYYDSIEIKSNDKAKNNRNSGGIKRIKSRDDWEER